MASIELDHVNVVFPVVLHKGLTFKEFVTRYLVRGARPVAGRIHALRDVSLRLKLGDRLGVIGHNGAGKSTLLRTIAGVYPAETGRVATAGRICSLFDITIGFEWESTGWDNIRFRSYLQGETPGTLRSKIDEIAEFSELGEFLDIPIKCYSTGMLVRLAFAIATSSQPEILLVDEVFAAGDLSFQGRAQSRIERMMDSASIIVMAGHDLSAIAKLCRTTLWLDHGRMRRIGPSDAVIEEYTQSVQGSAVDSPSPRQSRELTMAAHGTSQTEGPSRYGAEPVGDEDISTAAA